jgi:activator of 2-hydroxyglutaryl-CoA dehydratase
MKLEEILKKLHDYEIEVQKLTLTRYAKAPIDQVRQCETRVAEMRASIATAMLKADNHE